MRIGMSLLTIALGLFHGAALGQGAQPPLNPNGWNFILVPAFESESAKTNNLSITGLNHALRFAQMLGSLLAGKSGQIRQVSALGYPENGDDLAALESIEPFAVLNNLDVKVQKLSHGGAADYNSPAYVAQQLLGNQASGTYVLAMPSGLLEDLAQALTNTPVKLRDTHQYVVVSGAAAPFSQTVYEDQVPGITAYPAIPLPPPAACTQPHVTVAAKAPPGLHPYTAQTVYFVRHVEAHPTGNFENGNYVCQGQWRALGANGILQKAMHGHAPHFIFTSDPGNLIGCGKACSYIRPAMTIAPYAIEHGLKVTLAPYQWEDAADLAQTLFNRDSGYFTRPNDGSAILVSWEHGNIEKAVTYLFGTMYRNPAAAKQLPAWNFADYDTIWALSTDAQGNLRFENSCEGISTAALPGTCPAFFQ